MKTLTGSEKQINWANQIRETVLKYIEVEKLAITKRYNKLLAADSTDQDEEAKPFKLHLQRLTVVENFINTQTSSEFFINNLKNWTEYKTFEKFIQMQKSALTDEQAKILYRIDNEQLASGCYITAESAVKHVMKEAEFFAAARAVQI